MSDPEQQSLTKLSEAFNALTSTVESAEEAQLSDDCRLYLPHGDDWKAHIMRGSDRQYCYVKAPGQDFFHLIVTGEIFIQKGDEKLCLMCALREGLLTTNRLFWQFPGRKKLPKT